MKGYRRAMMCCVFAAALATSGLADAMESVKPAPEKLKPLTPEQFAQTRTQLGACIVQNNRAKVAKYLASTDSLGVDYAAMGTDPQQFIFYFKLDACTKYNVPQMMQPVFMTPGALRNLLLESAYLAQVKSAPKPLLDEKGQPALAPTRYFATKGDGLASATTYAAIADCAAANGSDLADAVLRTGAGLPDERQAAVALAGVIGQCVTQGQNITLTPATIRALAADGMYQRYAMTPTPAQASAK